MKTLPDYLRHGLDILSIGLNPSLNAVKAGYYFATPQNRFWPALNASALFEPQLTPSAASMQWMFEQGVGFTDVVKRPSRGSAQLRAADFREWAPVIRVELELYRPRIAWFHGKLAYENYLKFAEDRRERIRWGRQRRRLGNTVFFVTPNPSPANATYSLQDITQWYNRLARLRDRM